MDRVLKLDDGVELILPGETPDRLSNSDLAKAAFHTSADDLLHGSVRSLVAAHVVPVLLRSTRVITLSVAREILKIHYEIKILRVDQPLSLYSSYFSALDYAVDTGVYDRELVGIAKRYLRRDFERRLKTV